MASNTTIRRATASDAETIYRFICRLEGEDPTREEFDSIFFKNLEDPDCYYLIAEKNGQSVAFVGMQIQSVLHHTPLQPSQCLYAARNHQDGWLCIGKSRGERLSKQSYPNGNRYHRFTLHNS